MISNNGYIRGIRAVIKNEVISNIRYEDYKDTGCENYLTTKEYVDKKIKEDGDVGTFYSVDGKLVGYNVNKTDTSCSNGDFCLHTDGNLYQYDDTWGSNPYVDSTARDELNLLYTGSSVTGLVPNSSVVSFYDKNSNDNYTKNKINTPEVGQICLFTYAYETGKADTLRIYADDTTKWDDLIQTGDFTLQKSSSIDYLTVNYTYDKYNSQLVNMQVYPVSDGTTLGVDEGVVIELSASYGDDTPHRTNTDVTSAPISTLFTYYSYSGTSGKDDYNPIQFYCKGPINDNKCVYHDSNGNTITVTGTTNNNVFTPNSITPGVDTTFAANDIILIQSLDASNVDEPIESNTNYAFLVSEEDGGTTSYVSIPATGETYDDYFNKDLSLLCKFVIDTTDAVDGTSDAVDGTDETNKYLIKLISSPNGPFLVNSTSDGKGIWTMEDGCSLSYIKKVPDEATPYQEDP